MMKSKKKSVKACSLRPGKVLLFILFSAFALLASSFATEVPDDPIIDLGLSSKYYTEGQVPDGWHLKRRKGADAKWVLEDGAPAIKLHSRGALTFLEKNVNIDIREFPFVEWRWKVENILRGIDERTREGDDHPVRIFFVFEPSRQSFWLKLKRFIYLDRIHGHPSGGRFTEYLWSSHLKAGEIIADPGNPAQKLMVVEGGKGNLGKWLSYKRNLYEDYKRLYGEEPGRIIFIGLISDTDQTGQEALGYISDLTFHKK